MGDCRSAFRVYTTADGDRRHIEIVRGKSYNAAIHPYFSGAHLPEYPPPTPKAATKWCFSDPEMKRRRRVAGYKTYSMEGKVKSSLRRGIRWIKSKCSHLVHGR